MLALAASLALALGACEGSVTDLSLADYNNLVLTLVGADDLAGTVGQATDDRVRIRVTDERGRPVAGVSVEFRTLSSGGQVTPSFVRSDGQGVAEADWKLGTRSGEQELEVVGTDQRRPQERIVVRLPARARPATPEAVELSHTQVVVAVGQTKAITATVRDQFGNAIDDAPVQWHLDGTGVAELRGSGVITGLQPGTAVLEVVVPTDDGGPSGAFASNSGPAASPGNGRGPVKKTASVEVVESTEDEGSSGSDPVEPVGNPGRVADLSIASVTDTSVVLRFTQVSDGAGGAASYAVRFGSPNFNGAWNSGSSTERTFAGTAAGAPIEYEYKGLQPGTTYTFRVQAYRNVDGVRVNGDVSGTASGTTASSPPTGGDPATYTLAIHPGSLTLTGVGATGTLSATVRDAQGVTVPGADVQWSSLDASVATVSEGGLVTARGLGTALIVASAACCGASDTIAVAVVQDTAATQPPAQVTDLQVLSTTEGAVTLRWTAVDDGAGQPASYALRHQTPKLVWWEAFESEALIDGGAVGQSIQYVQNSLSPGTDYEFRLVAYRGTLGQDAAFGPLSNVVGGTTAGVASGGVEDDAAGDSDSQPDPDSHQTPGHVAPVFADSFMDGKRQARQDGFGWSNSDLQFGVSDVQARTGTHSLRFRFEGSADPNADAFAEHRFQFGRGLPEVWIEYWLWVPDNYRHRRSIPWNNKFFFLWDSGAYTGGGPDRLAVMLSAEWIDGDNSRLDFQWSGDGYRMISGPMAGTFNPGLDAGKRGRWNQVRIQVRAASGPTTSDGLFRMWWDGQPVIESTGLPMYAAGDNAFRNGYLFGWANSGFDEETIFYVDDFLIYDQDPRW